MRKHLIAPIPQSAPALNEGWLDLDGAAVVEVTSEEKEYPVEAALVSAEMRGWRASDSGAQTIRLIFDRPQSLKRISLVFEETETETHPKVRVAMVCGWRTLVSKDCATAGISGPQLNPRGRGISG